VGFHQSQEAQQVLMQLISVVHLVMFLHVLVWLPLQQTCIVRGLETLQLQQTL
jgi:hypothetical protein